MSELACLSSAVILLLLVSIPLMDFSHLRPPQVYKKTKTISITGNKFDVFENVDDPKDVRYRVKK